MFTENLHVMLSLTQLCVMLCWFSLTQPLSSYSAFNLNTQFGKNGHSCMHSVCVKIRRLFLSVISIIFSVIIMTFWPIIVATFECSVLIIKVRSLSLAVMRTTAASNLYCHKAHILCAMFISNSKPNSLAVLSVKTRAVVSYTIAILYDQGLFTYIFSIYMKYFNRDCCNYIPVQLRIIICNFTARLMKCYHPICNTCYVV